MRKLVFLILFTLPSLPAHADGVRDAFERINSCAKASDIRRCRGDVTTASQPLYDRIASYDIAHCIPKDIIYKTQQMVNKHVLVRAGTGAGENQRFMRLFFIQEQRKWKLDIPQSLRVGLGENWQKQVNFAEQLYLMLREQMGGKLNCAAVQEIIDGIPRKKN